MDNIYISLVMVCFISLPVIYYYTLMLGGGFQYFFRYRRSAPAFCPRHKFFIAIPAHNERKVIAKSLETILRLNYPEDMYEVFVVADHCEDDTAGIARSKGAKTLERDDGPVGNKSRALSYLFDQFLDDSFDAVVVFDADTLVHKDFLIRMNDQLCLGKDVIQGNHKVYNYMSGGFAALSEAAFLINNLFENAGRNALGLSAKLRGDSVCIRGHVIKAFGFGDGLAEDQYLRHILIRNGYKVEFEPFALGWGQAPPSWQSAKQQRDRWFRGNIDCNREHLKKNTVSFFKRPSLVKLDNLMEMILPKYTSYAFSVIILSVFVAFLMYLGSPVPLTLGLSILIISVLTLAFPILCLFFSKAPLRVYLGLLFGPFYIIWRFKVLLQLAFSGGKVKWIRTQRESV